MSQNFKIFFENFKMIFLAHDKKTVLYSFSNYHLSNIFIFRSRLSIQNKIIQSKFQQHQVRV